ncbi:MAG: hypothetical protein AAF658_13690 [Myxococcota bacterium]
MNPTDPKQALSPFRMKVPGFRAHEHLRDNRFTLRIEDSNDNYFPDLFQLGQEDPHYSDDTGLTWDNSVHFSYSAPGSDRFYGFGASHTMFNENTDTYRASDKRLDTSSYYAFVGTRMALDSGLDWSGWALAGAHVAGGHLYDLQRNWHEFIGYGRTHSLSADGPETTVAGLVGIGGAIHKTLNCNIELSADAGIRAALGGHSLIDTEIGVNGELHYRADRGAYLRGRAALRYTDHNQVDFEGSLPKGDVVPAVEIEAGWRFKNFTPFLGIRLPEGEVGRDHTHGVIGLNFSF